MSHILNFTELTTRPPAKNALTVSDRLILVCSLCENIQQLRNTRWVESYLPGIRVALCMYCSNFKFVPITNPTTEYVLYHHHGGTIFSTKLKSKVSINIKDKDLDIFSIK